MFRYIVRACVLASLLLAAGCISTPNQPLNQRAIAPLLFANNPAPHPPQNKRNTDDINARAGTEFATDPDVAHDGVMIGLTFSGGGTRAASYAFGVAKEIEATRVSIANKNVSLFEYVDMLSGVSGGSVTAAYLGLKGRAGLDDFRERFLIRDAEESLNTELGLTTLGAALGGGVNDQTRLPRWLDEHLFEGATMADLERNRPAHVHIYASDLYNRHPFIFSRATFEAICSDYGSYPLSHAVAASAAVPFVFSPIVLQTFPESCHAPPPAWVNRAINNREESEMLRSAARGFLRNRDRRLVQYVKLADGGLSDNFGVTGFVIERTRDRTPFAPLNEQQAVKLSRAMFLVANGGPAPNAAWARTIEGPSGIDMVNAISDTAIRANVRANFEAFRQTFRLWREELVRWRCSLPASRVQQLRGSLAGWNCRDVQFFIAELAFDQLGPERLTELSAVPTRFKLPQEQVDSMIAAGRDVVRNNETFQRFLQSLPGGTRGNKALVASGDIGPDL